MLATPHSLSLGKAAHPSLQEVAPARSAGAILRKVALHDFLFAMIAADILGAAALAIAGLRVRALPAEHAAAMVWGCIGSFVVAWGLSAYLQDLYSRKALSGGFRRLLSRATVTWAQTFGLILLIGFGLGLSSDVSRLWFLGWAGSVFVWIAAGRLVWRALLSRLLDRGYCLERALVLAGSAEAAARARHKVERESDFHIRVISAGALPGMAGAATLEWIEEAVREGLVDRIIVARFSGAMEQTNALLRRLARVAVDVTLVPDLEGLQAPVLKVDRIGMLPAIDLDFHPLSPFQAAMKRAEDSGDRRTGAAGVPAAARHRRHRDQARQPRRCAVPPGPHRLQRPAVPRVEVPHHVCARARRRRRAANVARTTAASRGSDASCGAAASTNFRNCSMSSPATCRSSARARMRGG